MATTERLLSDLRPIIGESYTEGLRQLLADFRALDVIGRERIEAKLRRAMPNPSEISATLREAVFARDFATHGAQVTIEPHGGKGPDLGVSSGDAYANVEIKRLRAEIRDRSTEEDLEAWWEDEHDPRSHPASRDRITERVRAVIQGANAQLIHGEANLIVLSDWSVDVARGNYRRATQDLDEEIASNGTYSRIGAVQYVSNWHLQKNTYFWVNQHAELSIPAEIMAIARSAAAAREADAARAMQRMIEES